jgi:hypothetical protein
VEGGRGSGVPPLPCRHSPRDYHTERAGADAAGGSETQAGKEGGSEIGREGGRQGGRGGGEGRGWSAGGGRGRRGCDRRSLLWGLGFAALGALGRELERATELRSPRSHRDERRLRRLGFSPRPAPTAPRRDRWESAARTGPRPPSRAQSVPQEGLNTWGASRKGGYRPSSTRAFQPPGGLKATPGLPCALPLTCAQSLPAASGGGEGDVEPGVFRGRAARGLRRELGCRLPASLGSLLWRRCALAVAGGSRVRTERVISPCEARPLLSFVKSCVCVTSAPGDRPAGLQMRPGQSWRAFSLRLLLPNRGRSLCAELVTDLLLPLITRGATRGDGVQGSGASQRPFRLLHAKRARLEVAATGTTWAGRVANSR